MKDIRIEAENFVTRLFEENIDAKFEFHNIKQVKRKVKAAQKIARSANLSADQTEILVLACWFHDTGFSETCDKHEIVSARIAREFLSSRKYPEQKIEQIESCIQSTLRGRQPFDDIEKNFHDAGIAYIGSKNYFKRIGALRTELEAQQAKTYTDSDWLTKNIDFIRKHDYLTDHAKNLFNAGRLGNLSRLIEKQNQIEHPEVKLEDLEAEISKKSKKVKTPDRGVETMFRVTSRNHFTLSSIADSKASTLISISALIISIIISVLVRRLSEQPELIIPTVIILITLLGTIIFAVLSTRPKITNLHLTREDVQNRRGNLLFFGNFLGMSVNDYEWGMQELMNDRDYLYNNLIRDIYYLGQVLGKKYRYLSLAYNFFMYGLILSVISYIIAFAL